MTYNSQCCIFHRHIYTKGLYAAIDCENHKIVGLIEASGPKDAVNPGWWIDSKHRNKGYGKAIVIELAKVLKNLGYDGVADICIQTYKNEYDQASKKLKEIFIHEFKNEKLK